MEWRDHSGIVIIYKGHLQHSLLAQSPLLVCGKNVRIPFKRRELLFQSENVHSGKTIPFFQMLLVWYENAQIQFIPGVNQSFTKSRLVQHLLACQEIRLTWVWIWDNYAAREPWIITGCRDEIVEYCGEGIRELFRDRRAQRVEKLDCWWAFWGTLQGSISEFVKAWCASVGRFDLVVFLFPHFQKIFCQEGILALIDPALPLQVLRYMRACLWGLAAMELQMLLFISLLVLNAFSMAGAQVAGNLFMYPYVRVNQNS